MRKKPRRGEIAAQQAHVDLLNVDIVKYPNVPGVSQPGRSWRCSAPFLSVQAAEPFSDFFANGKGMSAEAVYPGIQDLLKD